MAKSYPTSKVRDSGPECQAVTVQERREEPPSVRGQGQWARRATPHPRSVAAGRRHPTSEVRGGQEKPPRAQARGGDPEEPPRARGQGRQLGGATHTRVQGRWLGGATRGAVAEQAEEGLEEPFHVEGQEWQQ